MILATRFPTPLIFQKRKEITPSGCKDLGVQKFELVTKTQFHDLRVKTAVRYYKISQFLFLILQFWSLAE